MVALADDECPSLWALRRRRRAVALRRAARLPSGRAGLQPSCPRTAGRRWGRCGPRTLVCPPSQHHEADGQAADGYSNKEQGHFTDGKEEQHPGEEHAEPGEAAPGQSAAEGPAAHPAQPEVVETFEKRRSILCDPEFAAKKQFTNDPGQNSAEPDAGSQDESSEAITSTLAGLGPPGTDGPPHAPQPEPRPTSIFEPGWRPPRGSQKKKKERPRKPATATARTTTRGQDVGQWQLLLKYPNQVVPPVDPITGWSPPPCSDELPSLDTDILGDPLHPAKLKWERYDEQQDRMGREQMHRDLGTSSTTGTRAGAAWLGAQATQHNATSPPWPTPSCRTLSEAAGEVRPAEGPPAHRGPAPRARLREKGPQVRCELQTGFGSHSPESLQHHSPLPKPR